LDGVAEVARLLPRHWDGRRLLRFLTGLALLALAFAAPVFAAGGFAGPAADTPPAAVRTVSDVSAAGLAGDRAAAPSAARAAAPAAPSAAWAAAGPSAARTDAGGPSAAAQAAPYVALPLPRGGSLAAERRVTVRAGAALAAHGSRGPPLR
jgi:hypothetical protein